MKRIGILVVVVFLALTGCGKEAKKVVTKKVTQNIEFSSPWVRNLDIPEKSRHELRARVEKWPSRPLYWGAMMRLSMIKPNIDGMTKKAGVNSAAFYGLLITESGANPLITDNVFRGGEAGKVHVGLGQLNFSKLPKAEREDKRRIRAAYAWRANYIRWQKVSQGLKANGLSAKARTGLQVEATKRQKLSRRLLLNWAAFDLRFDSRWNLERTISFWKGNIACCGGDATLAIMAHHGGLYSPLRRVAYYRQDHEGRGFDPDNLIWLRREMSVYIKRQGLNFFKLYEDEGRSGVHYWRMKGDAHLTYGFAPVAWSEIFWRFLNDPGSRPKTNRRYPGEPDFDTVRNFEHTLWYRGRPTYQNARDLAGAAKKGSLVRAPGWLGEAGFRLARGIGKRDKAYQSYYQMASPAMWGMLRELGMRTQKEMGKAATFRIESLTRSVAYGVGSKTTSHNFGGAVDIDLNTSGLSVGELTILHRVLYQMVAEGKLGYYMEADAPIGGVLPIYPVPYDFRQGGQVHVIMNPAMKAYFGQVYEKGWPLGQPGGHTGVPGAPISRIKEARDRMGSFSPFSWSWIVAMLSDIWWGLVTFVWALIRMMGVIAIYAVIVVVAYLLLKWAAITLGQRRAPRRR